MQTGQPWGAHPVAAASFRSWAHHHHPPTRPSLVPGIPWSEPERLHCGALTQLPASHFLSSPAALLLGRLECLSKQDRWRGRGTFIQVTSPGGPGGWHQMNQALTSALPLGWATRGRFLRLSVPQLLHP